jgi:2'-5' RNA ligase
VPPFVLTLDRLGVFLRPGIAWAGSSSPPDALVRLVAKLGDGLTARGFRIERRPFHAHVTLARRCRIRAADPIRNGEPLSAPIVWNIARATLAASELVSGPSRYRELDGWALGSERGERPDTTK